MTSEIEDNFTKETDDIINGCLNDLKMKDNGYTLSNVRDEINKKLKYDNIGKHALFNSPKTFSYTKISLPLHR